MLKCGSCGWFATVFHSCDKRFVAKYDLSFDEDGDEGFCICPECGDGVYSQTKPHFAENSATPDKVEILDKLHPVPAERQREGKLVLKLTPGTGGRSGKIGLVPEGAALFHIPQAGVRQPKYIEYDYDTGKVRLDEFHNSITSGEQNSDPPWEVETENTVPEDVVSLDDMI